MLYLISLILLLVLQSFLFRLRNKTPKRHDRALRIILRTLILVVFVLLAFVSTLGDYRFALPLLFLYVLLEYQQASYQFYIVLILSITLIVFLPKIFPDCGDAENDEPSCICHGIVVADLDRYTCIGKATPKSN